MRVLRGVELFRFRTRRSELRRQRHCFWKKTKHYVHLQHTLSFGVEGAARTRATVTVVSRFNKGSPDRRGQLSTFAVLRRMFLAMRFVTGRYYSLLGLFVGFGLSLFLPNYISWGVQSTSPLSRGAL